MKKGLNVTTGLLLIAGVFVIGAYLIYEQDVRLAPSNKQILSAGGGDAAVSPSICPFVITKYAKATVSRVTYEGASSFMDKEKCLKLRDEKFIHPTARCRRRCFKVL